MKAYSWQCRMREKHVVVIAESVDAARVLALEDIEKSWSWGNLEWMDAEPMVADLPCVVIWDETE